MASNQTQREMVSFEKALERSSAYSQQFLVIQSLHNFIDSGEGTSSPGIIDNLLSILSSQTFEHKKTASFFYRNTTEALVKFIFRSDQNGDDAEIIRAFAEVLSRSTGNCHKGIAEGVCAFPVDILPPPVPAAISDIPDVAFSDLWKSCSSFAMENHAWLGRSLLITMADGKKMVLKLLRPDDSPDEVRREALWMEFLKLKKISNGKKFLIPDPQEINGSFLVRLDRIPVKAPESLRLHPERLAIFYQAPPGYFTYPNHPAEKALQESDVIEILSRNAWLLGALLSNGIVHTAPVPLFHNRVQRNRRNDRGIYIWTRGGRLDQWLASCAYPNFGESGLRDFEHLEIYKQKGRNLYEIIGSHILSLLLVAGSYFRNRDGEPDLGGDCRHLFDGESLKKMIRCIHMAYYEGFTNAPFPRWFYFDYDFLMSRMIEEMGVDRHMEEILRAVDQREMSREGFEEFLRKRGLSKQEIEGLEKGEKDITTLTGPHLGGFNQRISLPELITFLETASGLCIVGKFCRQNGVPF